jgi:nitroreductase
MPQVLDALMSRRSDRHFSQKPLEAEVVDTLFEAFRWAPSSNNRQPWRLLVADNADARGIFDGALSDANKLWAPAAPLKMVLVGNPEEQPDRNGLQCFMLDCGLALENLLIQGYAMGLTIHAMVGWDSEKVTRGFSIPAPMKPVALIAAGYRGRVEDLVEEVQVKDKRPRTRKPLGEIIVKDRFRSDAGASAPKGA